MAQLKDSIIQGNLRVTDSTLTDTLQTTTIKAPTTSGGTTYGAGNNGQALMSNGTTTYWGNLTTYSAMTQAEINAGTSGTARVISPANLKYGVQTWSQYICDELEHILGSGGSASANLFNIINDDNGFVTRLANIDIIYSGTYLFGVDVELDYFPYEFTFYDSNDSVVGSVSISSSDVSSDRKAIKTLTLTGNAVKLRCPGTSSLALPIFIITQDTNSFYQYIKGSSYNPFTDITDRGSSPLSGKADRYDVTRLKATTAEIIDTGSKNLMPTPDGQSVPPTRWINIPVVLQPGKYRVFFGELQSDDTDDTRCQAIFMSGSTQVSNWLTINCGIDVFSGVCKITEETSTFRLYPSTSYVLSEGDTVTFTDCMICKESDWQISQTYVPYCPTLPEIHEDVTNLQSQQTKNETALINLINTGSKNRLLITASSRTHNGITFTVNSDGTVTANGTATANAYIQVASIPANSELFDGSYRLCGCPTGGSRATYAQYAALSNYARYDYGESVSLIPTGLTGNVGLVIMVYAGYTANNVIFKPMICKEADYLVSPEYAQYCPTLPELYALIKSYHP